MFDTFTQGKHLYICTYLCRDVLDVIINDSEMLSVEATKTMTEDFGIDKVIHWRGVTFNLPRDTQSISKVSVPGKPNWYWKLDRVVYREPFWKFMSHEESERCDDVNI